MAAPEAADDELWAALELTHIADFVREQPGGLDMPIAPDAANLSGGQRQRLAIARALLRNTPIYVFDEATSSVDAESEAVILDTIRELAQSATVIMITPPHGERRDRRPGGGVRPRSGGRNRHARGADGAWRRVRRPVPRAAGHRACRGTGPLPARRSRPAENGPVVGIGAPASESVTGSDLAHPCGEAEPAPSASGVTSGKADAADGTGALIRRLLHEVGPLRPTMIAACGVRHTRPPGRHLPACVRRDCPVRHAGGTGCGA